ncbi:MAG: ion transporter [Flavobacteriales bacterium]|nr:ion transporter [Flavobacteriales bacterium]|tara:strand:- start:14972 stop:15808 length:837 start_codon:yes stop_codon:yes gene_type:complete
MNKKLKNKLYQIIFEAETPSGKLFDVLLLITIVCSVICVSLESVADISSKYGSILRTLEWIFTILFTIEYFLRIWIIKNPFKYIFSFMGIIDILAILPTYLLFIFNLQFLMIIRVVRLIRLFRILHLSNYIRGGQTMLVALRRSLPKIIVFLLTVLLFVIVIGTIMYLVEGPMGNNTDGFENIPNSIYWAIVTLTTVGYGSAVPVTAFGKLFASLIMLLGYGIIAVPTGIVASAVSRIDTDEKVEDKKNVSAFKNHSSQINDLKLDLDRIERKIDNLK